MENAKEENPFLLKCIVCSRTLKSALAIGESNGIQGISVAGTGLNLRGGSGFQTNGMLVCPNRHNYTLSEIHGFNVGTFRLEKNLVAKVLAEEKITISMKDILENESTKVYNVNYGLFTRIRVDRLSRKKTSPSYNVLDNVRVYVCAKDQGLQGDLILSCVGKKERGRLNKWLYNVVSYEIV